MAPTAAGQVTTLVWHRRDLRVHDNACYAQLNGPCLSVFVFDPMEFERVRSCADPAHDAIRTGPFAARVLIDAVAELRESLRACGGELIVRCGNPASILPSLVQQLPALGEVRWHEEPGVEEAAASRRVYAAICASNSRVKPRTFVGCTLYHPEDIPSQEQWAALAHPNQKHRTKKSRSRQQRPAGLVARDRRDGRVDVSAERLSGMPRIMGDWRRAARAHASPRAVLPAPETLGWGRASGAHRKVGGGEADGGQTGGVMAGGEEVDVDNGIIADAYGGIDVGHLPSLDTLMAPALDRSATRPLLGLPDDAVRDVVRHACTDDDAESAPLHSFGTESGALRRLHTFVDSGRAATADRALADVSNDDSSMLSVALALGSLSPRQVYAAAQGGAAQGGAGQGGASGCSWLSSHMEMRDFFIYSAFAAGARLYRQEGSPVSPTSAPAIWRPPSAAADAWRRWATGHCGLPLPDAGMRELLTRGYLSNRVRQNAASVLTKDLQIDWRAGAELFQWLLADHDVAANWGVRARSRVDCTTTTYSGSRPPRLLARDRLDSRLPCPLPGTQLDAPPTPSAGTQPVHPTRFRARVRPQNWQYFSGVGSDPKHRHFRTVSQAARHDPACRYVRRWLPELADVDDDEAVLRPFDLLGPDVWPRPADIDPATQITWQDAQRLEATGRILVGADADGGRDVVVGLGSATEVKSSVIVRFGG